MTPPITPRGSRIRILYLVSGLAVEGPIGGAARFATELARALDPDQYAPTIVALWNYGTASEQARAAELRGQGIDVRVASDWDAEAPLRSCATSLGALWRQRGSLHADIIHSHGEFSDVSAVLLQRRLGIAHSVRTFHNVVEWPKRPWLGAILANAVYPLVYDVEVGVSQRAYEGLHRRPLAALLGRPSERIYNAVDLDRFEPAKANRAAVRQEVRVELGLPPDCCVAGSYGRMVRLKGYHDLLDAAAVAMGSVPELRLLLAGDGPERAALERQAQSLGIAGRVVFAGFRRDVERLLQAMDLFVSPSYIEGLPTSVLEAMAAGVPVVATCIPGNAELIRHGISGVLTPVGDPRVLAQAIVATATGATCAQEMAAHAQASVRTTFSIAPVARAYEALYESLLRGDQRT